MSRVFDFDQEIDRSNSDSVKWEKYRDREILPMWLADTDFAVAPEIQQALHQRAEHPVFGYTRIPQHLVELIVARLQRLYHWSIDPDWFVPLPGIIGLVCALTRYHRIALPCLSRHWQAGRCGIFTANNLPAVRESAEL